MENELFQSIVDLGYNSIIDLNEFSEIINGKNSNINLIKYSKLISWLTQQLGDLCKIDEKVQEIDSIGDLSTFLFELNSFLKEFNCPYEQICNGNLNEGNYNDKNVKLPLIHYLSSELQASVIVAYEQIDKTRNTLKMNECQEVKAIQNLLIVLGFPKPPLNITWEQIFMKVQLRVDDLILKLPQLKHSFGNSLLKSNLVTNKQWDTINRISGILNEDFKSRINMLVKRLDVTLQSFKWTGRLTNKKDELSKIYQDKRDSLVKKEEIDLSDLIAARDELGYQEKTCSTRLVTSNRLHKMVFNANVPDRGGRTSELQPPPPEMPTFMQRQQQLQKQQRIQNFRNTSHQQFDTKWNSGQKHQQYYKDTNSRQQSGTGNNYRPQSDFERFQNQKY